jgi:hypothetical protein
LVSFPTLVLLFGFAAPFAPEVLITHVQPVAINANGEAKASVVVEAFPNLAELGHPVLPAVPVCFPSESTLRRWS